MAKRITCKIHDEQERVKAVGVEGEGVKPVVEIWMRIHDFKEEFYTYEAGKRATVKAAERNGTKYLTTHPDGITPNNLDELKRC